MDLRIDEFTNFNEIEFVNPTLRKFVNS